jgi:prepilin-type N-terminal cleavage/methylation domain-containing protein
MHASRRGFTLVEIIVAVSIVALIAALTIPAMSRSTKKSQLRSAARVALESIKQARTAAGSGTSIGGVGITRFGAFAVLSATRYGVYIDVDSTPSNGTEQMVKVVDVAADHTDNTLSFAWNPPGTLAGDALYFQSNGFVYPAVPPSLVITDSSSNQSLTVVIAQSGIAHINE